MSWCKLFWVKTVVEWIETFDPEWSHSTLVSSHFVGFSLFQSSLPSQGEYNSEPWGPHCLFCTAQRSNLWTFAVCWNREWHLHSSQSGCGREWIDSYRVEECRLCHNSSHNHLHHLALAIFSVIKSMSLFYFVH